MKGMMMFKEDFKGLLRIWAFQGKEWPIKLEVTLGLLAKLFSIFVSTISKEQIRSSIENTQTGSSESESQRMMNTT